MAENSKIEWTDATWTPIRARCWEIQSDGSGKERIGWHCEHVSEGCRNCYAENINRRLGTGYDFKPGNLRGKPEYYGGGIDRPECFLDEKMLLAPLHWKKPRMVFCCSMTDLFGDWVKDEWIDKIFAVMALCPQHTFQVLTKRAQRMQSYVSEVEHESVRATCQRFGAALTAIKAPRTPEINWPLPNVWLGISAERQQEADERLPYLINTPATVRFISYEPALGPLLLQHDKLRDGITRNWLGNGGLNWTICGGESGPKARPFQIEWADSLVDQCRSTGVACFIKQLGSTPLSNGYLLHLRSSKGGDPTEWPERLRVREMPDTNQLQMEKTYG